MGNLFLCFARRQSFNLFRQGLHYFVINYYHFMRDTQRNATNGEQRFTTSVTYVDMCHSLNNDTLRWIHLELNPKSALAAINNKICESLRIMNTKSLSN